MASFVICTVGELGPGASLAPERHRASALGGGGVALGELVVVRNERLATKDAAHALVLDTTHTRDGLVDVASARRATSPPLSAKKRVAEGDLLVSRLRPYLRQVAFVHPGAVAGCGAVSVACSTEYYVLSPPKGERIEYLLPFLLSREAQAILAAGQEGGHHPRVPLETLLALRVAPALVRARARTSQRVHASLGAVYRALGGFQRVLGGEGQRAG